MLKKRVLQTLSTALLIALGSEAMAQMKCTMPNGVTITRQLGSCPFDATAAFTLDGKPLPKPSDTPEGKAAAARQQQAAQERQAQAEAAEKAALEARMQQWDAENALQKQRKEEAHSARQQRLITHGCSALGLDRRTCEADVSIFKSSAIAVSTHLIPLDLQGTCEKLASTIRTEIMERHSGSGWVVRIRYTPTGRTIAECDI